MTAVDHAELKPCPFCGSAAKLETYGDRLGISCTECFCRTPLCQPGEDPLPIWNLRTQAPDSWRPTEQEVETVLRCCDAMERSVERKGLPKSEADICVATDWLRKVCAALRPQTAESGK